MMKQTTGGEISHHLIPDISEESAKHIARSLDARAESGSNLLLSWAVHNYDTDTNEFAVMMNSSSDVMAREVLGRLVVGARQVAGELPIDEDKHFAA